MTREEAIRIFRKEIECLSHTKCEDCILEKACDPMNTTPYDSEYIEAYSMAIEALEQEPTPKNDLGVDCISRQAVLEGIAEWIADGYADSEADCSHISSLVTHLPSVTPQEPQIFKWCTDCKEYDQEKHCCHRWSKVIRDTVEEMKQEPKTGHWISHGEHCKNLGVIPSGLGAYKWCSNCDCGIDVSEWHRNNYNFCPNCGAKMVEPQESEG